MQLEIEAKFLNVKHDEIRVKLQQLGAVLKQPMRLMRRALFDYPDKRFQTSGNTQRLRVRDEGNQITVTYKASNDTNYSSEVETTVGSFDQMCQLFEAIGLKLHSFQESKREAWHYKNVEIVLDEWPWVSPYIEIEGPSEQAIQEAAKALGLDWQDAKFGSVEEVYRNQYPGMTDQDTIGELSEVKFSLPLPDYLLKRQAK